MLALKLGVGILFLYIVQLRSADITGVVGFLKWNDVRVGLLRLSNNQNPNLVPRNERFKRDKKKLSLDNLRNESGSGSLLFMEPYVELNNFYAIPETTLRFLNNRESCKNVLNHVHPCRSVFKIHQRTDRLWPRKIVTVTCQFATQRCNVHGMDTCTTLVSQVLTIRSSGEWGWEPVGVACVCMTHRAHPINELLPMVV